MNKVKKVIAVLLLIAVVFSVASVYFNFALIDLNSIQSPQAKGNTNAQIKLFVEETELNSKGVP